MGTIDVCNGVGKVNPVIKNFFHKYPWQLWMIIVAAVIVQLILFKYKEVFHVDELATLGLAFGDKEVLLFHHPNDFDNHVFAGKDLFHTFMSVEDRYSRLWQNLPLDHHMPLYFILLNIFGTEFYTHFTILPVILVNVLSLIGLLLGFYLLAMRLFGKQEIALIGLLFLSFTPAVLSMEVFIRMYLLWMTLSVWGILYCVEFLQLKNKKSLIYVFIFVLAQILTHYYGIIFAFVLAMAGGLILLWNREYKLLVYFAGVMLGTVIAAVLIYPAMLKVGYDSERGTEFWDNVKLLFLNPKAVVETKLPYLWNSVFGGLYALLIELCFCIGGFLRALKKGVMSSKEAQVILFLIITIVGFGFMAAWVQPDMESYQVRYFTPIVPMVVLSGVYFFVLWGRLLHLNQKVTILLLWLTAAGCGLYAGTDVDNPFYFRGTRETQKLDKILNGADVWWAMGGGWQHTYYIHNFADKVDRIDYLWSLVDFDNQRFLRFSNEEAKAGRYAYLLFPPQQSQSPEWVINWVKRTTGRRAFYLFTIPFSLEYPISSSAAVFLVAPY